MAYQWPVSHVTKHFLFCVGCQGIALAEFPEIPVGWTEFPVSEGAPRAVYCPVCCHPGECFFDVMGRLMDRSTEGLHDFIRVTEGNPTITISGNPVTASNATITVSGTGALLFFPVSGFTGDQWVSTTTTSTNGSTGISGSTLVISSS